MIKSIIILFSLILILPTASFSQVVHDAEYYILESQNGESWTVEDAELDKKLAELREKYNNPPNIIRLMWDDTGFGDVGIPAINKIRGFETPNLNKMGEEGILFTRMYTEPSCTPSRASSLTGRHPIRNGMYKVGFPVEYHGLSSEEVTLAEVLSQAGYSTALYGKLHLGDIEQAWPHNQGFDETLFAVYNQIVSLWNTTGEGANAIIGLKEELLIDDPYKLDNTFIPHGWVMNIEGKKGEQGKEWGGTELQDYLKSDPEFYKRSIEFIRRNATENKPFYIEIWPLLTAFIPNPQKKTVNRGLYADNMQYNVDAFIGQLMDLLKELNIENNTILIAMADNGPMAHNPPPGLGMTETIYRGGKGDFLEGGVRVPAFAWWPGVIKEGQIVGDIIHQTDLFTTFARLAGATEYIPTDRIIDGIDQTALLLKGDTYGRRDYVFIYTGPLLGATVKGNIKRHWISGDPGDVSGVAAAYYDLLSDTREKNPMMTHTFHLQEAFNRMRIRHELWMRKYPNSHAANGPAYTGLSNARPETKALSEPQVDQSKLPFDPLEYIDNDLPWGINPDIGERKKN